MLYILIYYCITVIVYSNTSNSLGLRPSLTLIFDPASSCWNTTDALVDSTIEMSAKSLHLLQV